MSTGTMKDWIAKSSPALKARLAGIFYLINGMTYSSADGSSSA
ncbi:MAG TPA: hypothetical protein VKF63_08550 [Terracidiphilus sp.]|nr:hypothetical protein [Terracidiphilus sp.]